MIENPASPPANANESPLHPIEKFDSRTRIPALDGMRGVAILMVLLFHAAAIGQFPRDGIMSPVPVMLSLWCGVELFFVLSGFLITGILVDSKGAAGYFRTFYLRRSLRIFPLYYSFMGLVLLYSLWLQQTSGDDQLFREQVWFWTYLQNWRMGLIGPFSFRFLDHFWSLAIEEQFYLVWPFVVWCCSRRTLLWICAVSQVVCFGLRIWMLRSGYDWTTTYFLTPCRVDSLLLGAVLAILCRSPGGAHLVARYRAALLIYSAVIVGWLVWQYGGLQYNRWLIHILGLPALSVLFTALLAYCVLPGPTTVLQTLVNLRGLRWCGTISYGLYVLHYPVFYNVRFVLLPGGSAGEGQPEHTPVDYCLFLAVSFGATFALATMSWHLLEKRVLSLKSRIA